VQRACLGARASFRADRARACEPRSTDRQLDGSLPERHSRLAARPHDPLTCAGTRDAGRARMKMIVIATLLLATPHARVRADTRVVATATERDAARLAALEREATAAAVTLQDARAEKLFARLRWDAAVAGGHPVAAGQWARRHFDAMQAERAAHTRWQVAAARLAAARAQRRAAALPHSR
jgi:hypothetical protein